mgnify:CR=1 FL=1
MKGPLSPKYYSTGTLSKQAASLKKWGKQDWQTSDGSKSGESGKRYMPKAALAKMTAAEKAANNKKKKKGKKQFVANTKAGKRAMQAIT